MIGLTDFSRLKKLPSLGKISTIDLDLWEAEASTADRREASIPCIGVFQLCQTRTLTCTSYMDAPNGRVHGCVHGLLLNNRYRHQHGRLHGRLYDYCERYSKFWTPPLCRAPIDMDASMKPPKRSATKYAHTRSKKHSDQRLPQFAFRSKLNRFEPAARLLRHIQSMANSKESMQDVC